MKKIIFLVIVLIMLAASNIKAQSFDQGAIIVGLTTGQSYSPIYGLSGDYGLTENIGVGFDVAYTTHEPKFSTYKLMSFLASFSYHINPKESFDPFVRIGLGYNKWTNDLPTYSIETPAHKAGFGFGGEVGCRYFFSNVVAGRVMAGFPYYIGIGIDFRLL